MKRCASCTKDLPDAALHCVFCGAKQPPLPAASGGMAKTVMGSFSANDMIAQLKAQQADATGAPAAPQAPAAPPRPASASTPPPPAAPQFSPPPPAAPQFSPPPAAPQFSSPPAAAPQFSPPPAAPQFSPPAAPASTPASPHVPVAPSAAPTMFVTGGAAPQGSFGPGPRPAPAAGGASGPTLIAPSPISPPAASGLGGASGPTLIAPSPVAPPAPAPVPAYAPAPAPAQAPVPSSATAVPMPAPVSRAPYRAAPRSRPVEPWKQSLRIMMFIAGVALLTAFATPLSLDPMMFHWNLVLESSGTHKLPSLLMAAVGLLGVVIAGIPMSSLPRGLLAALLGLAGIVVPIAIVGMPPWQGLLPLAGMILLIPGLLVRNEYRDAMLPRVLITVGALATLLPWLLPDHGQLPLVELAKLAIDTPGTAKVGVLLILGHIALVVLSLLAWLPAPATGGGVVLGWLLIVWPAVMSIASLLLAGAIGDVISKSPYGAVAWISGAGAGPAEIPGLAAIGFGVAYAILIGYGLAAAIGKQLE